MRFIDYYKKRLIAGIEPDRLKQILLGNTDVTARKMDNGSIILSNNKIIKCVDHYYKPANEEDIVRCGSKSPLIRCNAARKALGTNRLSRMECIQCHLMCMAYIDAKSGTIKRK